MVKNLCGDRKWKVESEWWKDEDIQVSHTSGPQIFSYV